MNKTSLRLAGWTLLALAAATGLAACGGGDDDGPAVNPDPFVSGTQVPQSATQSADGSFAFANGGIAADNTGEPLILGDTQLGKSETDEPKPL